MARRKITRTYEIVWVVGVPYSGEPDIECDTLGEALEAARDLLETAAKTWATVQIWRRDDVANG